MNSKMKPYIIISCGLLLAGGGLSYWQWTNLDAMAKETTALRNRVESEGDVEAKLADLQAKVTQSKQVLDHLERGVPMRAYVPTMMREIEALGREKGIEVLGVRPLPPRFAPPPVSNTDENGKEVAPAPKAYEEQLIEIKGRGKYLDVLNLIAELEKFPKVVAVSQVTLLPKEQIAGEKSNAGLLEVTVELRSFLFPNEVPNQGQGLQKQASLNGGRNGQG